VCADASATVGKIITGSLEDGDIPSNRSQLMGGKQSSERAAEDDRAPLAVPSHARPTG